MASIPPPTAPVEPRDPSNRWPWIALIIGLVIVLGAIGFFVLNRSQTVNLSVEGTPTTNPVARASVSIFRTTPGFAICRAISAI